MTESEYDCIMLRLTRARAIALLISQAADNGAHHGPQIATAAVLIDDLLDDIDQTVRSIVDAPRVRTPA